jgi:exopolyphosphatase/guanosine-5'-triphosphate,3'-diphosphate pyrophosphatase
MNLAAIDVGSQSIRMSVFDVSSSAPVVIHSEFDPIALGRGGFDAATLGPEETEELVALFKRYRSSFQSHQVEAYAAVATSAMRNLSNGEAIIESLRTETGIEVAIIDGQEEAELSYQGVLDVIGPCVHPRWLVDIGGGSVEIIAEAPQEQRGSWSLPLGSWRFPQLCTQEPVPKAQKEIAGVRENIQSELAVCAKAQMPEESAVVALGGNVRALGWILSKRHGSPAEQPPMDLLKEFMEESANFSVGERATHYDISEGRAETVTCTATILHTVATYFGAQDVSTPHVNLRRCMVAFLCAYVEGRGSLFSHPLTAKLGRSWKAA